MSATERGDTPRTDAFELAVSRGMLGTQLFKEVRQLERELVAVNAEIERLRGSAERGDTPKLTRQQRAEVHP